MIEIEYRMPAEWSRHEATWIGWPHNRTDWPGKFSAIKWVYAEIVRNVAPGEKVRILVDDDSKEREARSVLERSAVPLENVEFFHFPTNRGWSRDFGPIFVEKILAGEPAIADFRFNAWAKYDDFDKDDRIASSVARHLGFPILTPEHSGKRVVLEGGAIEVNGRGSLITTEECLLDDEIQVRNPGFGRDDYEEIFTSWLGAPNVIWLGKGIVGDDTHGHVDDICRFVAPTAVVLCRETDSEDENYSILEENRERLEGARLADGSRVEVISLPMPRPIVFEGRRLPASYANFYICNHSVLVPVFDDPSDRLALGILAECFPDHDVVGVHSRNLIWGLGSFHCLTQQQPAIGA